MIKSLKVMIEEKSLQVLKEVNFKIINVILTFMVSLVPLQNLENGGITTNKKEHNSTNLYQSSANR